MPKNDSLHNAKRAKNDEFYTQYADIEREMTAYLEYNPDVFRGKTILLPCDDPEWSNFTKYFAQNFDNFGLKKLISTSYAADSKPPEITYQPTLFELNDPKFDKAKTRSRGKIFILEKDRNKDKKINIDDLKWNYLEGDGDFRSEEVCRLRDEADVIITNPPFSLYREFLAWVTAEEKEFCIISNMNCITYKEVFPLIKENKIWLGESIHSGDREFRVPESYPLLAAGSRIDDKGNKYIRVKGVRWLTNLDHGRRHQPLSLMTMTDNLKYSKHKEIRERGYPKYDNYNAIEVSYTDAIPSDYKAGMGVPISFLDKYCPEQFEIEKFRKGDDEKDLTYTINDHSGTEREREREERFAQSHAVLQNYYQEQDVMASWASQSPSLTSSVQNNLRLSTQTASGPRQRAIDCLLQAQTDGMLAANGSSPESLSRQKINGVMGVPISFLDKYCPEQFEIIALGNSRENFTPNKYYIRPRKHMQDGRVVNGGAINCVLAIEQDEEPKGTVYYTSDNSKYLVPPYARI